MKKREKNNKRSWKIIEINKVTTKTLERKTHHHESS